MLTITTSKMYTGLPLTIDSGVSWIAFVTVRLKKLLDPVLEVAELVDISEEE